VVVFVEVIPPAALRSPGATFHSVALVGFTSSPSLAAAYDAWAHPATVGHAFDYDLTFRRVAL
jgi:hypothetical protein